MSLSTSIMNLFQGCYETVKDKVFGNVYIMGGVLGGLGVIQVRFFTLSLPMDSTNLAKFVVTYSYERVRKWTS